MSSSGGVTSFALYTYNGALNWMQVPIGQSEQSEIESGDERRVQSEPGTHLRGCQLALVDTGYVVQVVHGYLHARDANTRSLHTTGMMGEVKHLRLTCNLS